ncbi:MAG TPA: MFS transporter [Gemmatimonadaceae bacterium]|nr:MFS transporter [Gemmatimonadaceae bacterium]
MSVIAEVGDRLDRLPATPYLWHLVVLLSIGGSFEMFELAMTASISPGLLRDGIFHEGVTGLFGLSDQATFAAATFGGLLIGTACLAWLTDRWGRRNGVTYALVWYVVATAVMAAQHSAASVDAWRFVAGLGLGVQLVTIDSYISELVPKGVRGRAFAVNQAIQLSAVPVAALVSWLLIPRDLLGVSGWRWISCIPLLGLPVVWWIRRVVPESPRWLVSRGRYADALAATTALETRSASALDPERPPAVAVQPAVTTTTLREIVSPPYRRRTIMLILLNAFQAIGFFGFSNWLPALLASRGLTIVDSLQYTMFIALAYPLAPLLCVRLADRFERKWQIVAAAAGSLTCGLVFASQSRPAALVAWGVALTLCNMTLSYAYHAYQSELYPTRLRARAVGFTYSFSRLAAMVSGFAIAVLLHRSGTTAVFALLSSCMLIVILSVALLGPRTRGIALEQLAG